MTELHEINNILEELDKKLSAIDTAVMSAVNNADEGSWITINGAHILIKDGESAGDAFKRTTGKELGGEARGSGEGGGTHTIGGKSVTITKDKIISPSGGDPLYVEKYDLEPRHGFYNPDITFSTSHQEGTYKKDNAGKVVLEHTLTGNGIYTLHTGGESKHFKIEGGKISKTEAPRTLASVHVRGTDDY